MNASELALGQRATIIDFKDDQLALYLNDLGLFMGVNIELTAKAPFGDPICIKTEGTLISIRKSDAQLIAIKKQS